MLAHPQPDGSVQWYRDVNEEPVLRLVTDVDGYVNIFPFVLRLLPADSSRLTVILRRLNNTEVCVVVAKLSLGSFHYQKYSHLVWA